MTRLQWGKTGQRRYETGVSNGALFVLGVDGNYQKGVAWNGLTTVTESPSGAESNKQYADNQVYVNIKSAEEFGATIEAFTYPAEFNVCDGVAEVSPGVYVGGQTRRSFGFSYQSLIGNDTAGTDFGHKVHIIYGADAAPSEKTNATVNDSPEPGALSWEVTTTPVSVGLVNGVEYKPTAHLTVDSTRVDPDALAALKDILYGTAGADPRLPLPGEVFAMFGGGTTTTVATVAPTYNAATDTITIPAVTGVEYLVGGEPVSGGVTITETTVVTARPAAGYRFTDTSDTDWTVTYS